MKINLIKQTTSIQMEKITTYKKIAGIFICLFLFVCSGCIHETLDPCEEDDFETCIRFNFLYDYNMEERDLFAEQVDHITLIIYSEESGELEQIVEVHRQDMEENHTVSLMLSPGKHTAVAWGNIHTEHYNLHSHESTAGHLLEMTCIDKQTMTTTRANPGSLFHASHTFTVVAGNEEPIPMKMIKNSNQVKVIIKGLTEEDLEKAEERFTLRLTSNNWRYNFANKISSGQAVTYLTEGAQEEDNPTPGEFTVAFTFYPLRLFTYDMETVLSLRYRNEQTGRQTEPLELPLIPYLLRIAGYSNTPANDNEYLDRQDTYEVPFVLGVDINGNISIEEWDGIHQGGEL